jgi:hypothetical protein
LQDERIAIDVVNHPGELDAALEIAALTDPYLDGVVEGCAAHRTRIARP